MNSSCTVHPPARTTMTTTGAVDHAARPRSHTLPAAMPILLDEPLVRLLLDVLGAIALFATAAIALSARDAVTVTLTVALLVVAARCLRTIRVGGSPTS